MGFMDQFRQRPQQPQQSVVQMAQAWLNSIKQTANGDATGLINYLSQTNPDFANFAQSMRGKTPQQAFSEFGLDYSQFTNIL